MFADIVLKNANVNTMNSSQATAELVAISGDKIMLVGGRHELGTVTGQKTKIIDCQGKTVMPGFNDAHCHIFSLIRSLLSMDLGPQAIRSIADIKEAVRRRAQVTEPGKWIIGTGYNEFYLAEKRHPTRQDIDEVAPLNPVVLSHRGLHACVLNSLALSLAGITIETPEPPSGLIDRDLETGEPNGILFDMLDYIRERVTPHFTQEELDEGIALANKQYLSNGITSLQDITVSNDFGRWQTLNRFVRESQLVSRVYMMFGTRAVSEFREAGLTTGSGDSRLRLGGVKIMLSEATGHLQPTQAELSKQALEYHQAGFQLAFHAVQESTVEAAIKALEHVSGGLPVSRWRHRLEHCSECPPDLLESLKKIKPVIVTQPPFIYYSGERYLATVPESKLPWLYRIKSFLDAGLIVAGSSDSPVVPDNPLYGIYAALTRKSESGQSLLPHERISIDQSLAMYTVNAAYASFDERIKGTITPGKVADIVVLSDDPRKAPPEEIKNIRVEMTIVDGKVVWER